MLSALRLYSGAEDVSPSAITHCFVLGFERALKEKGRSLNTVSFYMRNLRAVCNKCVNRGWIALGKKDLFKEVFTGVAPFPKWALSKHDMRRLDNLLSDPEELQMEEQEALWLFLFSFYGRGISFVDMAYMKKENQKEGVLSYRRRKTGTPLEAKINGTMKRIIKKLSSRTEDSPYLFPLINPTAGSVYESYMSALRL